MEKHSEPPLRRNDDVVLSVEAMGSEGQGIARHNGFAVFVPGALKGETIHAHIIKTTPSYAVGKLTGIAAQSPQRVAPACPLFARCGGCSMQHMSYDSQLAFKRQIVIDALERIGGFAGVAVKDTLGMETPWRYRNKGSFPFALLDDKVQTGFYSPRSHRIVPLEDCPIEQEGALAVAMAVREWARKYDIPPYDEEAHKGVLRHAMARIASDGSVMAVVVTTGALPYSKELVSLLRERVPLLKSVVHNVNGARTNVILGARYQMIWGVEHLDHTLCGLTFEVSAASFLQVNTEQTIKLYQTALSFFNPQKNETVADVYCGIGTISLLIAKHTERVIGIESVPRAIEDAKRNARNNSLPNAQFLCGNAEEMLPKLVREGVRLDAVVVDPPRKGCDEAALRAIADSGVGRVVYVSCNPATLARDCKLLSAMGYALKLVQPVDMFPQTEHVEAIILMTRSGSGEKK